MKLRIIIVLFLLFAAVPASGEDGFGAWPTLELKELDRGKFHLSTYGEARFINQAQHLDFWMVSEKFKVDAWKNLSLGLNYTYLETEVVTAGEEDMIFHHRAELEVNPHGKLGDWATYEIRDRMEIRYIEGKNGSDNRFRQRWTLDFPVKSALPLKSIYMSTEVFYDFALHEYSEQRTVPFGFNFQVNDRVSFKIYPLIRSKEKANNWDTTHFIGTQISIKL